MPAPTRRADGALRPALEHLVKGIVEHPDEVRVRLVDGRRGQRLEVRAGAVQHEHGAGVGTHLQAHLVQHAAQAGDSLGVVVRRMRVRADPSRPGASSLAKHAHLLVRT